MQKEDVGCVGVGGRVTSLVMRRLGADGRGAHGRGQGDVVRIEVVQRVIRQQ